MKNKQAIIFVVHKGKLESQALILAASLRYYNGSNFDLIACVPNASDGSSLGVSETVKLHLESLNVQLVDVDNPIGDDYLIGNKLNCLSATNHSCRTFLDTDMICTGPIDFPELENNQIAVKPADRKTYGWSDQQWKNAYLKFADYRLSEQDMVFSSCFREKMWPYFNAGLIHINGCPQFSKTWSNLSKDLDSDQSFTHKRPWLDQLSLPLVIKKLKLKTQCLTEAFNFPANIKDTTHHQTFLVHYHKADLVGNNRVLLKQLKTISHKYKWLLSALKNDQEWSFTMSQINSLAGSESTSLKEYFLTEIPCSGAAEICALLKNFSHVALLEHPKKVSKPISRRYLPWGVGLFFEQQQTQLTKSAVYSNLVVSMGTPLLTSISRVKQVRPQTVIVACINDPLETINTWSADFIHNLVESDTFQYNLQFLCDADKQLYLQYETSHSTAIKKAILWCLFANQLLQNTNTRLIHTRETVNQPKLQLADLLNTQFLPKTCFKVPSKTSSLNLNNDELLIKNITMQHYMDLINKMNTQRATNQLS